jgi:hypothetical protein
MAMKMPAPLIECLKSIPNKASLILNKPMGVVDGFSFFEVSGFAFDYNKNSIRTFIDIDYTSILTKMTRERIVSNNKQIMRFKKPAHITLRGINDLYVFDGGDAFEYIVLTGPKGTVVLRSWIQLSANGANV